MSLITWLLFESFYALAGVLALVLYGLLVYWRRGGDRRPLLFGIPIAVALLITQQLVVTQREHAAQILTRIERDLEQRSTTALRAALSPNFAAGALDATELVDGVTSRLRTLRLANIRRTALNLTSSSADEFVVSASYSSDLSTGDTTGAAHTRWEFEFSRVGGEWKLHSIQRLWIENIEVPLAEALR